MKISFSSAYRNTTYYVGIRRQYFSLSEILAAAIISIDKGPNYNIEFIRNDTIRSISHVPFEKITFRKGMKSFDPLVDGCSVLVWKNRHGINILDVIYTKHLGLSTLPSAYEEVYDNVLSYLGEIEAAVSNPHLSIWSYPDTSPVTSCTLPSILADFHFIFSLMDEVRSLDKEDFAGQNEIFLRALQWMQNFLSDKFVSMAQATI